MGMARTLDELRRAIESSGETRYAVAKRAGLPQSALSRLVSSGRGMTIDGIERVADALGMELVLRPKRGVKRKGR